MIKTITSLLPHQEQAVAKLRRLRVGALYMEMGTGKTRTALELAAIRMEQGRINHVIWLCPCSVKRNLALDIKKHCTYDKFDFTICGIESVSASSQISEELIRIAQASKSMLIVDESNMVKNPYALRSKRITALAELCPYRYILNGTPVSRTEADMFQQWYILDSRILGYSSYYSFAANHIEYDERFRGRIRRVLNVEYLTDKIAPYSVEIAKADCLELPPKVERTYWFDMTPDQYEHYGEVVDCFLSEANLHEDERTSVWIYKAFTATQQVASGRRIVSKASEPIQTKPFYDDVFDNPRIQELMLAVSKIGKSKTLVWCKYQHEIESVMEALSKKGYSAVAFTGRVSQKKRQINIERFATDVQFFVANKQCAGYGLNLQFCSNMVYYSNDWDWATRAQSEDRVHRIGQSEQVNIINIACDYTIDVRILECLARKTNMVERFKTDIARKNWDNWFRGKEMEGLYDSDRAE